MTDKEQIQEMARIAEYQLFDLAGDSDDVAKALHGVGYHKTIWHKVADEDLPQEQGFYLCYVHIYGFDRHGNEIGGYGYRVEPFVGTFDSLNASVIAWTDLPKYKEG